MKKELIYLASPYTHESLDVMRQRFDAVVCVAAQLMRDGYFIFSPISHTHPIASEHSLPRGWEYWQEYDELIISRCDRLMVLMLDGWKESKGVNAEIEIAERLNLPIEYLPASS